MAGMPALLRDTILFVPDITPNDGHAIFLQTI